jgi:hypothetical protein
LEEEEEQEEQEEGKVNRYEEECFQSAFCTTL